MSGTLSLDLRRQSRTNRPGSRRSLRILEAVGDQSPKAVKSAEKLVMSCRENVRFLNRHLNPYRDFLDLPELVDNVLYLAYTVTVKKNAPFDADDMRRALRDAGIETSPNFSFDKTAVDDGGSDTFCLPCHQYLTIRDLEYIIDTFESFFEKARHYQPSTGRDKR